MLLSAFGERCRGGCLQTRPPRPAAKSEVQAQSQEMMPIAGAEAAGKRMRVQSRAAVSMQDEMND